MQFGEYILQSEEGAQQGDPLGPLYFCLVFKELLDSLRSELVLGYLDDVVVTQDLPPLAASELRIAGVCAVPGIVLRDEP